MRKTTLTCGLLLATLWLQGCVVINTDKSTVEPKSVAAESEDMTIKEIDAVSKLSSQNARQEYYTSLAGRTDLSPRAQVHLVNAVFKHLSTDNAKLAVLDTLIANPSFSSAAKSTILERLGRLSADSHRTEILERLSKR